MKKKEIQIDVLPDGQLKVEGIGMIGHECDKLLKPFEEIGSVKDRKNKPEYLQTIKAGVQQKVGGG